jgi:type IV secretion system protein VirB8
MLKKKSSPKIDQAVAQGVNFELTIADMARRNEKRAWGVAICSMGISVLLAGGYYYMLPLKEKVPYLILADAYTGTSSLSRLTDDVVNRRITASEAVNRSNIAHFVLARESYDLALTNLRDWPTVLTMASPDVAQAYMSLHATSNDQSPYKLYGKNRAIRVKILSIVLIGGEPGGTPRGATVRFQRSVYDKTNGASYPLDSKIATMEVTYKPNLRMDDQNRIENPLGFQVTSYRVDSDYGSQAPAEAPAPGGAPAPAAPLGAVPADGTDGSGMPAAAAPQVAPAGAAYPQPGMVPAGVAPAPVAGQPMQSAAIPLQQQVPAVAVPPSPIPTEAGYAAQQQAAGGAASQPAAATPAARPVPRSAANGGRR